MSAYIKIVKNVVKECSEYRVNHILSILVIVLPIIFIVLLWEAVFGNAVMIGKYTKDKMIAYYVLCVLIQDMVYAGVHYEIASDIREGKLTNHLLKPINYLGYCFAVKLGTNIPYVIIAGGVISLYTLMITKAFYFQQDIILLVCFFAAVGLSFILSFLISFFMSLVAFWMEEISAFEAILTVVLPVVTGALLPISLYPGWAQSIIYILPFQYLLYFPVEIYLGNMSSVEISRGLILMILWIFAIYGVTYVLWKRGLRQYQAYGG